MMPVMMDIEPTAIPSSCLMSVFWGELGLNKTYNLCAQARPIILRIIDQTGIDGDSGSAHD